MSLYYLYIEETAWIEHWSGGVLYCTYICTMGPRTKFVYVQNILLFIQCMVYKDLWIYMDRFGVDAVGWRRIGFLQELHTLVQVVLGIDKIR